MTPDDALSADQFWHVVLVATAGVRDPRPWPE